MTPAPRRLLAVIALIAACAVLAALAAWPIYRTEQIWLTVSGAALAATVIGAGRALFRWRASSVLIAATLTLVVLIVPLGVPGAIPGGPRAWLRALGDGLAAIILGWKQLLTLTLPVGDYQAVLVPLLVTVYAAALAAVLLATGPRRRAGWAVLPLGLPILFGTVFGASETSAPLALPGGLLLPAPRELGIWSLGFLLALLWVRVVTGAERRRRLRRGAGAGGPGPAPARALRRGLAGGALVAIAAGIAVAVVPLTADPGARLVPRDRIDPELVVRERPSPLSGYRSWFQDERFAEPLFEISAPDGGPDRLGLAVLGRYDGAEFHVGDPGASGERFTRFPSGETPRDPVAVEVTVASGYADIWVPLAADLSAPPRFGGPRADALTEGFYLNRGSGTGVAVPTAEGLRAGDTVTLTVPRAAPAPLSAGPASADPLLGLDAMPELSAWLRAQAQPRTAAGLTELIDRLGQRGYLSHALSVEADGALWLDDLRERGGGRFLPSYAGHSTARIEELFAQLNEQQRAAGPSAGDPALVAGIGDDEQFAAAAALLARALGYDSRVVVGVRLAGEDPANAALAVPPCAERCSGGNLAAWVEVRGDDDRWVALDASPQWQSVPTELNEGEQLPEYATVPRDLSASDAPPPLGLGEHDAPAATDSPEPGSDSALWPILRAAALSVAALLLLALPVLFLPVAKRLRSRSRRSLRAPESRAIAAWAELIDRYRDAGIDVPASGSRRAQAAAIGRAPARTIAEGVERAVFSRGSVTEAEADTLWAIVDGERAALRAELGHRGRLRAACSLRSLRPADARRPGLGLRARGRTRDTGDGVPAPTGRDRARPVPRPGTAPEPPTETPIDPREEPAP